MRGLDEQGIENYTYEWPFIPPINHTDTTRMMY